MAREIENIRDSSCVESSEYEYPTLTIHFTDGSTYEYEGVGPLVYANFLRSLSPGWYFNKYIRNSYSYDRVG